MAIRDDSFSSVAEVLAFTPHLLSINSTTQATFNSTTRPTLTQVERFIDRASGVVNVNLWKAGFDPASVMANSTARLPLDDIVTMRGAAYAEMTQRGEGFSSEEGSRHAMFLGLSTEVNEQIELNSLGWKRMGVAVANPSSEGLYFTGLLAQYQRTDPTDPTLEQPIFKRGQFNNRLGSQNWDNDLSEDDN